MPEKADSWWAHLGTWRNQYTHGVRTRGGSSGKGGAAEELLWAGLVSRNRESEEASDWEVLWPKMTALAGQKAVLEKRDLVLASKKANESSSMP